MTAVKVGDYFVDSWGYDQTNVDFYRVVGVTPSGKSVRLQKWTQATADDDGGPVTHVLPGDRPATFTDWSAVDHDADYWDQQDQRVERDCPVTTHRLRPGGTSVCVAGYRSALLHDGRPMYQTGSGWGH